MSAKLTGEVNLTMRYTNATNTSGTIMRYRYHRFMPVKIRQSRPSSKKSRLVEALRARTCPSHFLPLRPQGEPPDCPSLWASNEHLPILYLSTPLFREWPRLPFTARIKRPLLHRGGSASKKGTWSLPFPFFSLDRGTPHLAMIPGLDSTLKRRTDYFRSPLLKE